MNLGQTGLIWYPLHAFGFNTSFYGIEVATLCYTFIASLALWIFAYCARVAFQKKHSMGKYVLIKISEALYALIHDAVGFVESDVFIFAASLFCIIFFYNISVVIPFVEEPTGNLNVTIAAALYAIFYIHKKAYQANKSEYMHHWIKFPLPFSPLLKISILRYIEWIVRFILNIIIAVIAFPFELLSRSSAVISLAFRLYGNIFGGSTISHLLKSFLQLSWKYQLIGMISGIPLLVLFLFGFLEGFIQAFVFMLVTVNNLGMLMPKVEKESQQEELFI